MRRPGFAWTRPETGDDWTWGITFSKADGLAFHFGRRTFGFGGE